MRVMALMVLSAVCVLRGRRLSAPSDERGLPKPSRVLHVVGKGGVGRLGSKIPLESMDRGALGDVVALVDIAFRDCVWNAF